MRIGIEAQRIFRSRKHGMDVVAIELIKNLQEIDSRNQYFIFSRNGVNDDTIKPTANFHLELSPSLSYVDWEQALLPKAAKKYRLDLLHCTANTAPLMSQVPLLLTLHDIIYMEQLDFKGTAYQNLGNLYRRFIVPRIVKKAKLILTVSAFERANIMERFGLPEEKVRVLYNGVSPQFHNCYPEQDIRAFREQYGLPPEYIMFLGNTAPKKNTVRVITAYVHLCTTRKQVMPMVLLDYRKELVEKLLAELNQSSLIGNFIFPGYVPHHQMPLIYNAATVFLYPSLRESFGLPILEAMACNVPVVTSNTSSMPEVAGDAAILVNPFEYTDIAKGMETALENSQLTSQLREKGKKRAAGFTWRASAEALLSIYESLT